MGSRNGLFGRRKDGSLFPADIWLNPIEANGAWLTLCIVFDITERKRAEEALVESEGARIAVRSKTWLRVLPYVR